MAKSSAKKTAPSRAVAVVKPAEPVAVSIAKAGKGADITEAGFGDLADTDEVDTEGNTQYGKPQSSASIMALLREKGLKTAHVGGTLPPAFPEPLTAGACRLIVPLDIEHISKEDGNGSEFDVLVCDVYNLKNDEVEYRAQINLSKGLEEFFIDEDGKRQPTFTDSDSKEHDLGWGAQVYAITYAGQLAGKGTKAGLKLWRVDIIEGLEIGQ